MTLKKGFTLVELTVVTAVFAVICLAAASFLVSIIRGNNQTIVQNEVRENAAAALDDIMTTIRNSACVDTSVANRIVVYSKSDCINGLIATYSVSAGVLQKNGVAMTTPKVAVCGNNTVCGTSCSGPGLIATATSAGDQTRTIEVKLKVKENSTSPRVDFCAHIDLQDTATPRNPFN